MDGKATNNQIKSVPSYDGKNMSPLKPLEELKDKVRNPKRNTICETLTKLYEEYCTRDEEVRRDTIDTGKMIANLTAGKVKMLRHPLTNQYRFIKSSSSSFADNRTVGGVFQFFRTKLDAEWLGSKPDRDPLCPSDDDRIEDLISAVKIQQDHYNRKFYTDRYETEESHSAQEFGTYIERNRYNPQTDDLEHELLYYPACIYDVRYMPEEGGHFIYEQKYPTKVLKNFVGEDIEFDEDGEETVNYGLQVIEEIARQGGGTDGIGKDRDGYSNMVKGETVVTEMWLQPEVYCDLETEEAEETVSGTRIPAKTKLIDIFPNGIVAIGINRMKVLIGLYGENHKEHIISGVYHFQSFSGIGKGISDAIDVKKEMDDLHSQAMAYVKGSGMPGWAFVQGTVTEDQVKDIGKPNKRVPVDFTLLPDRFSNINQVVQPMQPQNPASAVFEYGTILNEWLRMAFQVMPSAEAVGGVSKTAEGDRIRDANTELMLVPQHRYKADMRCRADKVRYNLFRKFVNKPKFFATKDINGLTKGKYLSGKDFADVEIEFQVVADSEVPKTPYSKEVSITKLMVQAGGLGGLLEAIAINPEVTGAIAQKFGADLPIAKTDNIARVCRRRIEQIKKLVEKATKLVEMLSAVTGQPIDIGMAVEMITGQPALNGNWQSTILNQLDSPITEKEPYHQQKVMWIAELFDVDEMNNNKELRSVLSEMQTRHIQMETLNGIEIGQAQNIQNLMANLPSILGEQLMGQFQQGQQQGIGQEQIAQQQQMEQQKVADENATKEASEQASHQRAMELSSQNHQQSLQLESIKQLSALESRKPSAKATAKA